MMSDSDESVRQQFQPLIGIGRGRGRPMSTSSDTSGPPHYRGRPTSTSSDTSGPPHGRGRPTSTSSDTSGPPHGRGRPTSTSSDTSGPPHGRPTSTSSDTSGPPEVCRTSNIPGQFHERLEPISSAASAPSSGRPTSVNPGPSSGRPTSVNPGPSRGRPASVNPGPSSGRPTSVNPGPSRGRPASVNPGPSSGRPTSVNPGPSRGRPASVNPGPSRGRPTSVNPGSSRGRPASVNPGPSRGRPASVNTGSSHGRPTSATTGPSRGGATSIISTGYIRRPTSPILPGNYVPNRLKDLGGFQMVHAHPDPKQQVCSWLDEQYDPNAPIPPPREFPMNSGHTVDTTPRYLIEAATGRHIARADTDSESGIHRSQAEFERDQRQEILASLYAQCEGDDPGFPNMPHYKRFLVVDFGIYNGSNYAVMPGEFAIADFSIFKGINSCYSRMLDPQYVPFGYRCEIMDMMKKKGYMEPGFDKSFRWDKECFNHIKVLMDELKTLNGEPGYLYVMPADFKRVKECLLWVATGLKVEFKFKLMPFPTLVHILLTEAIHLRNLKGLNTGHSSINEVEVLKLLSSQEYNTEISLACSFHQLPSREHMVEYCCTTRVKTCIYNALKLLTKYYRCSRSPFNHYPKIEREMYVPAEPVPEGPTVDDLNDETSSVSPSVCSTGRFLMYARGASTSSDSVSVTSNSYISTDGELGDDEMLDDKMEARKRFVTLETYPQVSEETGLAHSKGGLNIQPDMKDRQMPRRPIPYNKTSGKPAVVTMPTCKICRQGLCICAGPSSTCYERFIKAKNEWDSSQKIPQEDPEVRTARGELGKGDSVDVDSDDTMSSVSTSTYRGGVSTSHVPASPARSTTSSLNLPHTNKNVYDEMDLMRHWQKVLPSIGSAGRGQHRWAGDGAKVDREHFRSNPFNPLPLPKVEEEGNKENNAKEKQNDKPSTSSYVRPPIVIPDVGESTDSAESYSSEKESDKRSTRSYIRPPIPEIVGESSDSAESYASE